MWTYVQDGVSNASSSQVPVGLNVSCSPSCIVMWLIDQICSKDVPPLDWVAIAASYNLPRADDPRLWPLCRIPQDIGLVSIGAMIVEHHENVLCSKCLDDLVKDPQCRQPFQIGVCLLICIDHRVGVEQFQREGDSNRIKTKAGNEINDILVIGRPEPMERMQPRLTTVPVDSLDVNRYTVSIYLAIPRLPYNRAIAAVSD
mmetsp:Transcript_16395/g.27075  ORF Transcript_16395/g.27075 Transcript_16395/m.27075 type:complete len:201 (-) Transcript_16395:1102-1704(-)